MDKNNKTSRQKVIFIVIAGVITSCLCLSLCGSVFLLLRPKKNISSSNQVPTGQEVPGIPQTNEDPENQIWLVMLYLDADDAVLEEDILFDLNEAELIGSTDQVFIVAQIDRYKGAYSDDGDWTSTHRYKITRDGNLEQLGSELLDDMGEVDMDTPETLVDFASWAINSYPADRYVLIMSDHGMGWPGGWFDPDPGFPEDDYINLVELESALGEIIERNGISQLDLIGMDACLMSMLEVYTALSPYASYAVASEEVEPSLGWAYSYFLKALTENPGMDPADLSRLIVEGYIDHDQRVQDERARIRFLESFGVTEEYSAEELAADLKLDTTIAAVDLSKISGVNNDLDILLNVLKSVDQALVAQARAYAQPYENIFSDSYPSPYIDLFHFTGLVAEIVDQTNVDQASQQLLVDMQQAIVAEKHGDQRAASYGISIFFPVSDLFWDEYVGLDFYTSIASSFSDETLWDDFLSYHYAGQEFGLGNPTRDSRIPAPGTADINISNLLIEQATISSTDPYVNVQVDISGEQIAYIYIVSMLSYQNDYLAISLDYVMGDQSIEQSGVVYPKWERKNGVIHLNINYPIQPTAVCNGNGLCVFALTQPSAYHQDKSEILYYADGFYTFSENGNSVDATMRFFNYGQNRLRNIVGFFGEQPSGSPPANITPRMGDQFTFADIWWKLDGDNNRSPAIYEGNTLTFGSGSFSWGVHQPDPGDYVIGIWVEDMDGNFTEVWAPITVVP